MMTSLRSELLLLFIVFLLVIVFFPADVGAREIDLEEALETGRKNNSTLRDKRREITGVEREITRTEAGRGWNLDVSSSYDYIDSDTDEGTGGSSEETLSEDSETMRMSLQGSRELGHLNLSSDLGFSEVSPSDFAEVEDELEMNLEVSSRFFPLQPSESKQNIDRQGDDLTNLQADYRHQEREKEISWLKTYLELVRDKQKLDLLAEEVEFSRENLEDIKQEYEIEEAGERELQEAEVSLKEAENSRRQQKASFTQERDAWYRELGLREGISVEFSLETDRIEEEKAALENGNIIDDREALRQSLLRNSSELAALEIDLKWAERELEWAKDERWPELNTEGSYQLPDENWQVGLSLTHDLFDGGAVKIDIEEKEEELADLKDDLQETERELEEMLAERLEQLELAREQVELARMRLENEELKSDNSRLRHEREVITELEYRRQLKNEQEAEVDLAEAKDELFIEKLQLLHFVGEY